MKREEKGTGTTVFTALVPTIIACAQVGEVELESYSHQLYQTYVLRCKLCWPTCSTFSVDRCTHRVTSALHQRLAGGQGRRVHV